MTKFPDELFTPVTVDASPAGPATAFPHTRVLSASPDILQARFHGLSGLDPVSEVAEMLEITSDSLKWYLYTKGAPRYRTFFVRKRRGGKRTIREPTGGLKILQRKLLQVLTAVHPPRVGVHGFAVGRSVKTNAAEHVGAHVLLNVDILDFFPSIHFGRVRGMFCAKPYDLPPNVASVLAQLCCCNGELPQGAPTSPIIANMVSARLDGQLRRLAAHHRLRYTRYADDLTFSTQRKMLPYAAVTDPTAWGSGVVLGEELIHIVESNGFKVNLAKVHVARRTGRMEVTGIVVNTKTNLPRSYVRQIRAMLHVWEKYGKTAAAERFLQRHDSKDRSGTIGSHIDFAAVVRGKLDYLRMVRGVDDDIYAKLVGWYADLDILYTPPTRGSSLLPPGLRRTLDALWIIESLPEADVPQMSQGSGFMLRGFGLVTCAHVVSNRVMTAFRADNDSVHYAVAVHAIDPNRDLAVLRFQPLSAIHPVPLGCYGVSPELGERASPTGGSLRLSHDGLSQQGTAIHLCGFPNYSPGQTPDIRGATVASQRTRFSYQRLTVQGVIVSGMSGGPAVDTAGRVLGVIATGVANDADAETTDNHGIIPASVVHGWRREIDERDTQRSITTAASATQV